MNSQTPFADIETTFRRFAHKDFFFQQEPSSSLIPIDKAYQLVDELAELGVCVSGIFECFELIDVDGVAKLRTFPQAALDVPVYVFDHTDAPRRCAKVIKCFLESALPLGTNLVEFDLKGMPSKQSGDH